MPSGAPLPTLASVSYVDDVVCAGMSVRDLDPVAHLRKLRADRRNPRCELGRVQNDRRVGVVEQIHEFVIDIAVVHVDVRQPRLERRSDAFAVFGAIAHVERDFVTRPRALVQGTRQIVGAAREIAPSHDVIGVDQCNARRIDHRIDGIENVAVVPTRH